MTCIDIGGYIPSYEYDQWNKVIVVGSQNVIENHEKVVVCNRPLYNTCERVNVVDGRISLKLEDDSNLRAITIKQLAWDYLEDGEKVAYINCDINGDEMYVLEDLLYFAYVRQSVLNIKFYGILPDVGDLMNLFYHVSPSTFIPKSPGLNVYKPNPTVAIISYNWYTFTKQMVDQLKRFTKDIVILDNKSTFPPLLDYHQEYDHTLFKFDQNYGHLCWFKVKKLREIFGDTFIITDPDLLLNPDTPQDFMKTMYELYFKLGNSKIDRLGLALYIDKTMPKPAEWESQYWRHRIFWEGRPEIELYKANVDTTFCIVNVNRLTVSAFRIAGNFTAKHIPWHEGWKDQLVEGEHEWYKKNSKFSTWV